MNNQCYYIQRNDCVCVLNFFQAKSVTFKVEEAVVYENLSNSSKTTQSEFTRTDEFGLNFQSHRICNRIRTVFPEIIYQKLVDDRVNLKTIKWLQIINRRSCNVAQVFTNMKDKLDDAQQTDVLVTC